jgi:prevent-host-death family protein
MAKATALQFQRRFGEFQHRARSEPVEITRHGRREFVLLSAEQYDWLTAAARRHAMTKDAPPVVVEAVKSAKMHPRHGVIVKSK